MFDFLDADAHLAVSTTDDNGNTTNNQNNFTFTAQSFENGDNSTPGGDSTSNNNTTTSNSVSHQSRPHSSTSSNGNTTGATTNANKRKSSASERNIRSRNERKTKKRRKSKACYQCRKSHKACSFARPCTRCVEKHLPCASDSDENDEELPVMLSHLRKDYCNGSLEQAFHTQVHKINIMAAQHQSKSKNKRNKSSSPPVSQIQTKQPQQQHQQFHNNIINELSNSSNNSSPQGGEASNSSQFTGGVGRSGSTIPPADFPSDHNRGSKSGPHVPNFAPPTGSEYLPPQEFFDFFDQPQQGNNYAQPEDDMGGSGSSIPQQGNNFHMDPFSHFNVSTGFPQNANSMSLNPRVRKPFRTTFPNTGMNASDSFTRFNTHLQAQNDNGNYGSNNSMNYQRNMTSRKMKPPAPEPTLQNRPNMYHEHRNATSPFGQQYQSSMSSPQDSSDLLLSLLESNHSPNSMNAPVDKLLTSVGVSPRNPDDTLVSVSAQQLVELVRRVKSLSQELSLTRTNPFTQCFVSDTPVCMLSFHYQPSGHSHDAPLIQPFPVLLSCNPDFLSIINNAKLSDVAEKPLNLYHSFGRHLPDPSLHALIYSVHSLFAAIVKRGSRKVVISNRVYRETFVVHLGVMYAKYELLSTSMDIDDEFMLNGRFFPKTFSASLNGPRTISREEIIKWVQRYQRVLTTLTVT